MFVSCRKLKEDTEVLLKLNIQRTMSLLNTHFKDTNSVIPCDFGQLFLSRIKNF